MAQTRRLLRLDAVRADRRARLPDLLRHRRQAHPVPALDPDRRREERRARDRRRLDRDRDRPDRRCGDPWVSPDAGQPPRTVLRLAHDLALASAWPGWVPGDAEGLPPG